LDRPVVVPIVHTRAVPLDQESRSSVERRQARGARGNPGEARAVDGGGIVQMSADLPEIRLE
jgi:hypothetical protein